MALTKQKKHDIVAEVTGLLRASKMTVIAAYPGTTVKAMQKLRKAASENGTTVRVVKNRLVIKALQQDDRFKRIDTNSLTGQLVYAFNSKDEVAAAQVIAQFAKTNPTMAFVGGLSADGALLSATDVTALASLPGKHQLIAAVIATLISPLQGVMSGLSSTLPALLDGVSMRAQ